MVMSQWTLQTGVLRLNRFIQTQLVKWITPGQWIRKVCNLVQNIFCSGFNIALPGIKPHAEISAMSSVMNHRQFRRQCTFCQSKYSGILPCQPFLSPARYSHENTGIPISVNLTYSILHRLWACLYIARLFYPCGQQTENIPWILLLVAVSFLRCRPGNTQ